MNWKDFKNFQRAVIEDFLYAAAICFTCKHYIQRWSSKVKVKVKLSLCLTKHHTMKIYVSIAMKLYS